MASFTKWLGAGLGWTFGGPIGGIIGFVLGSYMDGFSEKDIIDYQKQTKIRTTSSGDFEVSLLVLAALVIKADGKVDKRELEFVRSTFTSMYGQSRANQCF